MKKIINRIKKANNILIVAHRRPDGDSISSQIGLYLLLRELGKNIRILNNDEVPELFSFLKFSDKIKTNLKRFSPDIIFFLDSARKDRIGERILNIINKFENAKIINIDHHISNNKFGDLNYIDYNASSTSELIFKLYKSMLIFPDKHAATALLTGILTDTGFFKFDTVNENTLSIASQLIACGGNLHKISREVYMSRPASKIKLISIVFNRMKIIDDKVISYIKNIDFEKTHALEEYTDGIVNEILYIKNINAAVLVIEDNNNVRVSFRSKTRKYNMNKLASKYGGGGHINASGAYIKNKSIKNIVDSIIKDLKKL